MPSPLSPVTQRQALVTIQGLNGTFTSLKGGKVNREKVKYPHPTQGQIQTFVGFTEYESITVSKIFDPVADKALTSWLKQQKTAPTPFNVSVTVVQPDLAGSVISGAAQIVYNNCILGDYKLPEWDRQSTGLAMIEIEIIFNEEPIIQ